MALTIHKYEFDVDDEVFVKMPAGAEVLCVGTQNRGKICIWAKVSTVEALEDRHFSIRGTGHPCSVFDGPYIGTVFDGPYVWHIFFGG